MLFDEISSDFSSMHTGEMLEGVGGGWGGRTLCAPRKQKM
jgi:hypothetical protein